MSVTSARGPLNNAEGTGSPVKIIEIKDDDHRINFYPEQLERILQGHKKKKVAVLSVAGAFRTGKSFLLSYIVKALSSKDGTWKDDRDTPLNGWFPWKSGSTRMTTGIDIWSKPIPMTLKTGEEIIILLMDTQGTFDHESTTKDCATVFALSTLLSSTLIYNLQTNITKNDFQNLQMWVEYGKLALEQGHVAPFQEMLFLVRDWQYPQEYSYGKDGGNLYIQDKLKISGKEPVELQKLRTDIKNCFEKMACFLLPHPGLNVPSDSNFDGCLKDLQAQFVDQLKELLEMLATEYVSVKTINGTAVTGRDLTCYFKEYANLFEKGEMPQPLSIVEANANVCKLLAVDKCAEVYETAMEKKCGRGKPCMDMNDLSKVDKESREEAKKTLTTTKLMGSESMDEIYNERILGKIEAKWKDFQDKNKVKIKKNNESAATRALRQYQDDMEFYEYDESPSDLNRLLRNHIKIKRTVLQQFDRSCKKSFDRSCKKSDYGSTQTLREKLDFQMDEKFEKINKKAVTSELEKAVCQAKFDYMSKMSNYFSKHTDYLVSDKLDSKHEHLESKALRTLDRFHIADPVQYVKYKGKLEYDLEEMLDGFEAQNEKRVKDVYSKAYRSGQELYMDGMGKVIEDEYVKPDDLARQHSRIQHDAVQRFRDFCSDYETIPDDSTEKKLKSYIDTEFEKFKEKNKLNEKSLVGKLTDWWQTINGM